MAGLARDRGEVGVDAFIFMLLINMTLFARDLFGRVDGVVVGDHASQHLMVGRDMTVGTQEVFLAHVDVNVLVGEVQAFIKVAVLHTVAAAAVKVALATIFTGRRAHTLGRCQQVHSNSGVAEGALAVDASIGVAGETVHVIGICQGRFAARFPAVAGVAGHALVLISLGADAEVVDLVDLADGDGLIAPGHIKGFAFPSPMRGHHHIFGSVFVTFQAGLGDILWFFKGALDNVCMIHVDGVLG